MNSSDEEGSATDTRRMDSPRESGGGALPWPLDDPCDLLNLAMATGAVGIYRRADATSIVLGTAAADAFYAEAAFVSGNTEAAVREAVPYQRMALNTNKDSVDIQVALTGPPE
jgi:hypothetical protein